jgi:RHS repeat-associated protein
LNTTKNGIAFGKNYQDNFAFDATGNWLTYKQDTTGAGFSLTQARTHNAANEVLTIAGASTHVANDANGNMTKVVKPDNWNASFTLVYDAWNRLVIVKDGTTTVATYFYDGMNHRIKKVVGTETRLSYFNRTWQCLEEYIGTTCDARYVWGLRYIDDLVTYRKGSTDYYSLADANWNVIALTNASGVAQERYTYSAFGKLNIFDAAFNVRSASSCSITRTFTGQVRDNETGLMLYRNRIYHPTMGRFVQRDPIGYSAHDENIYRIVFNRITLDNDPSGNAGPLIPIVVIGAGAVYICECERRRNEIQRDYTRPNAHDVGCINRAISFVNTWYNFGMAATDDGRYYYANENFPSSIRQSGCRLFYVMLPQNSIDCTSCSGLATTMANIIHENIHLNQWGSDYASLEKDASKKTMEVLENTKKSCKSIVNNGICKNIAACEAAIQAEIDKEKGVYNSL